MTNPHEPPHPTDEVVQLTLYVAGESDLSRTAIRNFDELRSRLDPSKITTTQIDILANPEVAWKQRIVATPILIRETEPVRKIVGDLSNGGRIVEALNLIEYLRAQ